MIDSKQVGRNGDFESDHPVQRRIEQRTLEQRVELVRFWSQWFYDHTDTFQGVLALGLAYLWPAILNAKMIEVEANHPILRILADCDVPKDSPIYDYLDIVPDI